MKLALGTVQFGLDYGISNTHGKVKINEIEKMLSLAKTLGITTLDTAAAYGQSETVLGSIEESQSFSIISKIPSMKAFSTDSNKLNRINMYLDSSLNRLNAKKIDAMLFHDVNDLINSPNGSEYFNHIAQLKKSGKIKKIGVSVYSPDQLIECINRFKLDIVQLPLNCLDQRFTYNHLFQDLKHNNIEIHCRSVFLQGLLLMKTLPEHAFFQKYKAILMNFKMLAKKLNTSLTTLALSIIHRHSEIEKVIIGCCDCEQLEEIVESYYCSQQLEANIKELQCDDLDLINPSRWPSGV